MDSPVVVVPKNTAVLTGPLLFGIILNWYLYGILAVQYVLYVLYSRNDRTTIKFIVHTIFLLDTIQTILTLEDAFYWFVYHFGDISKIYEFHYAPIDVPLLDALIAFLVQSVYCWRIWRLSKWRVLPALTIFIAFVAAVCGVAVGIRDFTLGSVLILNESYRVPIMLWLFGSAITDIIIASSMTYILLNAKNGSTRIQSTTGRKITRLLTLILETNTITAAVAIETVVIFFIKPIAPPRTNIYEPGGYLLGKLYSNCFMVLLNQHRRKNRNSSTTDNNNTNTESGTLSTYTPDLTSVSDPDSPGRGIEHFQQRQMPKLMIQDDSMITEMSRSEATTSLAGITFARSNVYYR